MAAAVVRHEARRFTYRGQELVRDVMDRAELRVCPHCLRRDLSEGRGPLHVRPYGRATWLMEPIRTCPEQHVALVVASEDDHPQRLHDFSLLVRPHLVRVDRMCDEAGERTPSNLETYLLGRLEGSADACWLEEFPFHPAAKSCEVIGAVPLFGAEFRDDAMNDELWQRAGGAGFDILVRGKDGMRDLLMRLQEVAPNDRSGLRPMYGRIETWLGHDTDDKAYDPLRTMLAQVAAEIMPLREGRSAFGRKVEARRLHWIRSASQEFAVHPKRLRKLLLRAGFIGEEAMSFSNDHVHFSADGATEFLTRVGRSMSLKEARDYLSLPRPLERHLLDVGILVPFHQGAKGDIDHAFDRQDLDDLLARLVRNARPIGDEDWKLVPVSKAATRACVLGVDVVKLLLDGKLATVRLDPGDRAFAAIRVDAEEVKKVSKPEREGLSLKQVEKRMGASTSVVKALVDLSILPSRTLVNPVSRRIQRVVEEDDLDEFLRRYISARNLALRRAVHIGKVTATMRALGIAPAFAPDKVNATFFEVSQVGEVTFK